MLEHAPSPGGTQRDALPLEPPDPTVVRMMVRQALTEDVGPGDITATAVVPRAARAVAHLVARTPGVLAGAEVAALAFALVEPQVTVECHRQDGARLAPGQRVLTVQGPARGILTAERVALNFVQRLSGVATLTARYVAAIEGTRATIVETRKTTPGLRVLEKYAVRAGGGRNHRQALYDGILIKDNHLLVAGSVGTAIERAQAHAPHTMRVQVEVDTLAQVEEALAAGADAITFDNMSPEQAATAVGLVAGRAITEASGQVTLETVRAYAAAGVDIISVGALTHSAPALDLGLDFAELGT